MDWKQTLKRIALSTGRALWFVLRHLCLFLAATAKFIVMRVIPAAWRWLCGTAFPALRRFYLWLPHRRIVAAGAAGVAAIAIAVLLLRTPGDTGADMTPADSTATADHVEAPAKPVVLKLLPAEAAPGAPVVLDGLTVAAGDTFEVWIEGWQAAAQRLPDGRVLALAPVQLGPDGWPVAPAEAQAVEVRRNGRPIAISEGGLRIVELPRAPGTTAQVQRSLETITDAYERIFEALPAHRDSEMAHRRAVIAMLRALVSEGDHSLAAVLAGTSPLLEGATPDLALTDALLASSGAAAYLQTYAAAFEAPPGAAGTLTVPAAGAAFPMLMSSPGGFQIPLTGGVPKCKDSSKDSEIACLMQIEGLLTYFSQDFVKPTADAYATGVGLSMGAIDFSKDLVGKGGRAVPVIKVISSLLSVVNLVIEKVAPSLLPASLTRFELEVADPLIRLHETTRTKLMLEAQNNPRTITVNDLVDLVKAIIGLPGIDKNFENIIVKVFNYAIDIYFAALRQIDGFNPGASDAVNPGVFSMPAMKWGPVEVTNPDLVTLFSFDEQVLASQKKELEWRGERPGQATVIMRGAGAGDSSKMLLDHTLCTGCVWSGGAFGDKDIPESKARIAVDIEFNASPQKGYPPLDVRFTWRTLRKEDSTAPIPCTLDFGDGSPVEHIADCTETHSFEHTYLSTSRLEADTGGHYVPTIRLDGGEADGKADGKAEVATEWSFRGYPATGQAPLDTRFTWQIPWPEDRQAPACELDPGDGSARQRFDDCLATIEAEHTFERRGSFVPMLTIIEGDARDTKTAPVSVADEGTCDAELTRHKAWTGTVSYSQSRDAWNESGTSNVKYSMNVRLGAEMHERTRREFRGSELVQYYSPLPQGSGSIDYSFYGYWEDGQLRGSDEFSGTGPMQRQEKHMTEDGSSLTLTIDAHTCTYQFHLQGQTLGSGERWERGKASESYQGHMNIQPVWGEGPLTSHGSIRGTRAFPVLSRSQVEDNSLEKTDWVGEYYSVEGYLGEGNLGTVTVSWDFQPAD